jgi:predicted metalloprotease
MRLGRATTLLVASAITLAACGGDVFVTAEESNQVRVATPPDTPSETTPEVPVDRAPDTTAVDDQDTSSTTTSPPEPTLPPAPTAPVDPTAIDFGPNKPPHDYDDFLLAVMTDLDTWWTEQYPLIYGETFESLQGEVYAAYPGRPDDLPGCGTPRTRYEEVQEFVAFYCGEGDFMVYDDGEDGLLAGLAETYGPSTIGTVLAHEFGHAIQLRTGALTRSLPTILTEQQADCFAGAWTGRAARGEATTLFFTDADVRAGLIAMTEVSDPVGIDQFLPGGHGSGFDRVGAFQVGFLNGPSRCSEILDNPLPLVPNELTVDETGQIQPVDAPFGFNDDELLDFIPTDLNLYWDEELAEEIPTLDGLTLVSARSTGDASCSDLRGDFERGAALCPSTGEVFFNEPAAFQLYDSFGDFSVGYVLGWAWSEAAQLALASELQGESRELLNDCLTGAWVKTVVPIEFRLPQPRSEDRTVTVSAGDLDEAIQTVILLADLSSNDNIVGSAFEKIDAFRQGVIGGLSACLPDL